MSTASKLVTPGCGSLHRPDNLNNIPDTATAAHHATANIVHLQIATPNRKTPTHNRRHSHGRRARAAPPTPRRRPCRRPARETSRPPSCQSQSAPHRPRLRQHQTHGRTSPAIHTTVCYIRMPACARISLTQKINHLRNEVSLQQQSNHSETRLTLRQVASGPVSGVEAQRGGQLAHHADGLSSGLGALQSDL
jgi:hypothetical protein